MKHLFLVVLLLSSALSFSQKTIPNTTVSTLQGRTVKIQDEISKDKITVLSFWATWCVPCINELDAISDVYDDWKEETNVEIIAISIDDSRTQRRIRPLVNGKGWEYKILIDKNQELKRALNISVVPHIIILKGSKILYRHTGYSPGSEDKIFEIIKKNS